MSDTTTCPNCTATLPAAAAFCTSCGNRLAHSAPSPAPPAAPAPPPPGGPATFAPPPDPTRFDGPPVTDPTQVLGAPPASHPPSTTSAPWQPADGAPGSGWGAQPAAAPPPPGTSFGTPPQATATGQVPAWSPTNWDSQSPPLGQPATPNKAKGSGTGSVLGAALAALGGLLTLVGLFLPWVTSGSSDAGLSGWDLTSGDKGFLTDSGMLTFESMDPYILLVLAVGAIITGLLAFSGGTRSISRILGVVSGIAIIGLMVRDWTSLANVVETKAPSTFEVSSAIGFYLAIAGGALVILSALMPSQAKKAPDPTPL